jgi:hypothetical protein
VTDRMQRATGTDRSVALITSFKNPGGDEQGRPH